MRLRPCRPSSLSSSRASAAFVVASLGLALINIPIKSSSLLSSSVVRAPSFLPSPQTSSLCTPLLRIPSISRSRVYAGVEPRKKKSGKFTKMKKYTKQSKSGIMKRIKNTYRPCVVLIDGTNMRGKFGFKWSEAGLAGLVAKWAKTHSMEGKAIVVFDNKNGDQSFVSYGEAANIVVAGASESADEVITKAIGMFHEENINTVVCTNDKKLMKECVEACGVGMRARNFFFTNDDFIHVLRMPVDYVRLKGKNRRGSDMDDQPVAEAVQNYLSSFPEGDIKITSFHGNSDIYVSPENELDVFPVQDINDEDAQLSVPNATKPI